MSRLNKSLGIATALIMAVLLQSNVYASNGQHSNAIHDRIVGLWDVNVALHNCVTGLPIPNATFQAMHQYHLGGTGQIVPTSDPTPQALSAHMSVWNHIKNNDYEVTVKMYRFDPEGTFIGWVVIRNQVTIDDEANGFVGTGVAEFFNAAGEFQFSSCPNLVGTRFND